MGKTLIKPKIVVICGQTGSGKTSLTVSLCKKFNGEIINADSRQVYGEMNIGTGKDVDSKNVGAEHVLPDKKAQYALPLQNTVQGISIWLVDIVKPNERYNVGRFKKDAEEAIGDIISREKAPFVVGGTGLYIDALIENFQIPMINDQSISNIQYPISKNDLKNKNLEELVKLLRKVDLNAMKIVNLKNRRRVERALEYFLMTGEKFSESRKKGERRYEVLKIAPMVDREVLYKKIDQRVDKMISQGLENEVKMLAGKYGWSSEAMTGIGYGEWKDYSTVETNGRSSLQQIKDQIKQSTRNYAKRQMTWFKRDKEIHWVRDKGEAERLVKKFLSNL